MRVRTHHAVAVVALLAGLVVAPRAEAVAAPEAPTAGATRLAAAASYATVPGVKRYAIGAATREVIVVRASSWGSTAATLTAYARRADGRWIVRFGPLTAHIGRHGLRPAASRHEGDGTTPAGNFTITQAFGRYADPGTALPYRKVRSTDYWVGDSASAYYNRMRSSALGGFRTSLSEHLSAIAPQYDYAAVVDFNRSPVVKGRGSAIFLHVSDGRSTAGCIAVPMATMKAILRWLAPSAHPRIVIGQSAWLAA